MALGDFDSNQTAVQYGESLLAAKQEADLKRRRSERRDRKIQYGVAALGVADDFLARKANKQIQDLNESMEVDLIMRKSDFKDKTQFETLYDTIDGKGFDPKKEESYAQYFYNLAVDDYSKGNIRDEDHKNKDNWIEAKANSYIYDWKNDLKTWQPQLRATEEEFTLPVRQYYAEQIKEVLSPSNTSAVRKLLEKVGLLDKKEIQSAFVIGQYTGALAKTKNAKEAYQLAMKNTNARLEALRTGAVDAEGRPALPELEAYILTSKKVSSELRDIIGNSANVDEGGMFYLENMPLIQGTGEGATLQDIERNRILGTTASNNDKGSLFANRFRVDSEELGWDDAEFQEWLNGDKGNYEYLSDMLVHPLTGNASPRDIQEIIYSVSDGGLVTSRGAIEMFQRQWERNAQDRWDMEKRERGIKLTEGADPATWEKYIEQGFIDTVNYNLKLMDDGRLLIVPTDKLITMKDQLGPSINQARAEGGEDVPRPEDQTGEEPVITDTPERTDMDLSEEDQMIMAGIEQQGGPIESFNIEAAIAFEKRGINSVKGLRDKMIQLYPEQQKEITEAYENFQEVLIADLSSSQKVARNSRQMLADARQDVEGGVSVFMQAAGRNIAEGWNNRLKSEAIIGIKRLLEVDQLSENQQKSLQVFLNRLNISPAASREDILFALTEMDDEIIQTAGI